MDSGRKKIWICLWSMILVAVVVGSYYYYNSSVKMKQHNAEGTLVERQEGRDGC